jgi:Reverse transcriptase (RNA-dependent DNA polymerase)
VFREQWAKKRDAYLKSGHWKITSAGNMVPMLLILKPRTSPVQLRAVVDLREQNKNTHCLTSPLPDMEGMLRRAASKLFWSMLDLKSAYEQIQIVPEHVERSTVTMPDRNMVSQIVQIEDCNAPATNQALMNHLFLSFINCFMDVYLDDIVVHSSLLREHVEHVKLVLGILEREKLYLSKEKLRFLTKELQILGRIIDNHGIWMDPNKVDTVIKWKTPTNCDLLRGFIGSVGYLADNVPGVWLLLGILSAITGDAVPFWWGYTEQRAFEDVKELVQAAREHQRWPLDYALKAHPVWMVTDGCAT